ncbi:hypothetical protein [Amycolatopsis anabasis]|uniref:hypothetical protein n=1 Tax=Amycolatopsis anabasis TaxID=1840409 RepID=UPI0015D27CDB|nr:hypothetical protein [Amycolatopsis anabasis]
MKRGLAFNDQLFRWNVVFARVAGLLGEREAQRRNARATLKLAQKGPTLPHKPDIGVVRTDKETLAWLRRLAADAGE